MYVKWYYCSVLDIKNGHKEPRGSDYNIAKECRENFEEK